MNTIYRIIESRSKDAFVLVADAVRSRSSKASCAYTTSLKQPSYKRYSPLSILMVTMILFSIAAQVSNGNSLLFIQRG